MPETRGREIHEIVKQLMRESERIEVLPEILPELIISRNNSTIERVKNSIITKISVKTSVTQQQQQSPQQVLIPQILVKSASNRTINDGANL